MSTNLQSTPAILMGQAQRISVEEKTQVELETRPAILKATIQIKRAATGKVEEYEIIGTSEGA